MDGRMKIGEVADRVGLSLRTIRFYEEAGLVIPDARSTGGFRLYTEDAIDRLKLIKAMKPLDFSVEEIAEVLTSLDALAADEAGPEERDLAAQRLATVQLVVDERLTRLLERAEQAREFARMLDDLPPSSPDGRPDADAD